MFNQLDIPQSGETIATITTNLGVMSGQRRLAMKDTKQYNISVFEDTMRRIKETPLLSYKVEDSLRL